MGALSLLLANLAVAMTDMSCLGLAERICEITWIEPGCFYAGLSILQLA